MKKIIILFLITLFVVACSRPKNVIERQKFVEILAEIHINDAILAKEGFFDKNITAGDSISFYNHLFKKYDITRQQYKENLEYYSNDIEDFLKIYNEVSTVLKTKLVQLDSLNGNNLTEPIDTLNLWNQQQIWNLPENGENETIKFSIEAHQVGTYTLSADIKIFEDDGSQTPRITINAYYKDGTYDSNEMNIVKNGEFKNYSLSIVTNKDKQLDYLSGWLLNHNQIFGKKHIQVKNIQLRLN